ncbi:hypothetical protein MTO96_050775 [Rhipicephalus appendiculatus]
MTTLIVRKLLAALDFRYQRHGRPLQVRRPQLPMHIVLPVRLGTMRLRTMQELERTSTMKGHGEKDATRR